MSSTKCIYLGTTLSPSAQSLSEYVTLNVICLENVHITHEHTYSPNPFSTPVFFKEYWSFNGGSPWKDSWLYGNAEPQPISEGFAPWILCIQ